MAWKSVPSQTLLIQCYNNTSRFPHSELECLAYGVNFEFCGDLGLNPANYALQAVMALSRSETIRNNPIRDGLNSFRSTFKSTCEKHSFALLTDSLGQIGAKGNAAILPRPWSY
jgi:hypothetical protein